MEFENKVAMITGAAVGIGRGCALKFAAEGASLVLLDRDEAGLVRLRDELRAYTENVLICPGDVSDEKAVEAAVAAGNEKFGHIDILVNNAAIWRQFKPFVELTTEEWQKYLSINVMGAVFCTRAVLPGMLARGWGRVVNVSSVAGVYGKPDMVHYSATKGALIAMTQALAKEVVARGVLVNCVSPGSVSPSENHDIDYHNETPLSFMGRSGTDRENAELIAFLASDRASYIAGQNVIIDGCRKLLS